MKPNVPLLNPYLDLFHTLADQPDSLRASVRKKLIWAYSWAVPTSEAIELISELSPLVELGAGTGYWAWLLRQNGAKVQAFDREPGQPPSWSMILKGDESSLGDLQDHTLFLCWPPLNEPMGFQALKDYTGQTLIYIGEWSGRTADSEFHDELERNWELIRTLTLPSWPGYSDQVYYLRRNR